MKYDINVRISNRHVHLTEEMYNMLFDEPIEKRNDLNQIGQFAAKQTVTLKNGDKIIENVRVLGPFRDYNQIELSKKDARTLDLNPPVRTSGDLEGTPSITLVTSKNEITVPGVIILTTSLLTIPLAVLGSSNCSHIAILYPFSISFAV